MGDYYALNADHSVVPVSNVIEWARSFEDQTRYIARDEVGEVTISTVFLGIDHSFDNGPPLLFETMIFGGTHDQDQWRYSTWDEAISGHHRAVQIARDSDTHPKDGDAQQGSARE